MPRFCAFFASMNVGGHRLKMTDLRDALEREDMEDVETVVASGNVLFSFDDRPTDGLSEMLAFIVKDRFGFPTFAAVRSADEVRAAFEDNPFHGKGEDKFVHTLFLDAQAEKAAFEDLLAAYEGRGPEKMALGDRCLYVDYVESVGTSKLTGVFIERKLDRMATGRNMRSLKRIHEKMV
ncbi:DUF1697 domain-containing protein [Croceicoccus naphthovorans]|uniref:Uncharacterized protein n=1 Tax=Croceicoccus naphthovorans TaxID=1348774 RepID=A0A0G3XE03_9SPHN|nr:DUF1697 domain-containing protein [Croceicoccus naphthovorans]AKM08871.1 hypothetical protein AB433_00950 [Croceicoccus naphthovorans]MBB3989372.1 uncharacterized protein (DUF1697 family) [Croceicoccus naphthovorans]